MTTAAMLTYRYSFMEVKVHQLVFFILVIFLLKISVGDNWRSEEQASRPIIDRKYASKLVK
jgi:ABC-type transport system involved in cytochrome c biogenesis permease component